MKKWFSIDNDNSKKKGKLKVVKSWSETNAGGEFVGRASDSRESSESVKPPEWSLGALSYFVLLVNFSRQKLMIIILFILHAFFRPEQGGFCRCWYSRSLKLSRDPLVEIFRFRSFLASPFLFGFFVVHLSTSVKRTIFCCWIAD